MLLEIERINKVEEVKRDNEKARQREHAAFLQAQAAKRQFSQQLDANSKTLERQAIDHAEREYMARVSRELEKTRSRLLG